MNNEPEAARQARLAARAEKYRHEVAQLRALVRRDTEPETNQPKEGKTDGD